MALGLVAVLISGLALTACVSSIAYSRKVETRYPATGTRVEVNGHDVHVRTAGDAGPTVLMLHGASANSREFAWTLAPGLADTHRVLMADRPGHGYSQRPRHGERLGIQAQQMASVLAELSPDVPAVVVGHSFGGAVALRLALDHPERVSGVVLLAPVTHDWGGGGQALHNRIAALPLLGAGFAQLAPILGPGQVDGGIDSVFDPAPAPPDYYRKSAIGLIFRPRNFRANARDLMALREEVGAQQARYDELDVPVVVFSGSGDTVIKPQLHVGRLKHQVEGLELVALAEGGHMPHHAHGEQVTDVIRRLASQGRAD